MSPTADPSPDAAFWRGSASLVPDAVAAAVKAEVGPGAPVDWTERRGSRSFNRIFLGELEGRGAVVLKVYGYREGARRQAWCMETLPERGVSSVPVLLASGETLGFHWTLGQRRGDANLADIWEGQSASERGRLMREIGVVVRQLHDLTASSRHGEMEEGDSNSYLTWSALLTRKLERSRAWYLGLPASALRDAALIGVADLFSELRHFHPRSAAMLVTRDLHLDNLTVTTTHGLAEVEGIVDFDYAGYAPGEVDLGHLLWFEGVDGDDALLSAFYDGYGLARTMDVRRREVVYRTLAALVQVARLLRFSEAAPIGEHEAERCLRYLVAMH